jgi:hypothetical protein
MPADDGVYRELLLTPIRKCADYLPKMGNQDEVDLDAFTAMYGSDPLYHWVGLDSPMMFAAHKAAGGMTSVYRQLGIGCERVFRQILHDGFGLDAEQVQWAYEVVDISDDEADELPSGRPKKPRKLTLDGRVELADVADAAVAGRVKDWIDGQKKALNITTDLKGAVFEVRQGYKSADSKRQNADLSNAAQGYGHGYLPSLIIMSTQINYAVRQRYEVGNLPVLTGVLGLNDPLKSTFDFSRDVVGYDLAGFFERNSGALRSEVEGILKNLLEPK